MAEPKDAPAPAAAAAATVDVDTVKIKTSQAGGEITVRLDGGDPQVLHPTQDGYVTVPRHRAKTYLAILPGASELEANQEIAQA